MHRLGLSLLFAPALASAAVYYLDVNGAAEGSGAASGSHAWSSAIWSANSAGTSATGTLPTRNTAAFSAGTDGFGTALTITGASGEMESVIVEEGSVTIQTLTRLFVNNSVLRTRPGTSLTIQNSPDFYNNTITLDAADGTTITLAGAASGSRNARLVKTGPGLVVFQGANTGSSGGTLTIHEGEYRILHNGSLSDGASVVNSGGTLSLANNLTVARALTLRGSGHQSLGALRSVSGANTWAGLLTLGSAARIAADAASTLTLAPASGAAITGPHALVLGGAGDLVVSRPISSVASLTKDGPGLLTLAAANTFTGTTTVSAGTLRLVESGGALASLAGPLAVDATVEVINAAARAWSAPLSGGAAGRFIKQGGGALTLSGSHSFAGTVALQSGTLALASGASLGSVLRFELTSGATLDVSAVSAFTLGSGQTLAGSGTLAGSAAFASGSVLDVTPGVPLTVSGSASFSSGAVVRLPATLANGTYPLLRSTGGTLVGVANLSATGFVSLTQSATLQLNGSATELALVVATSSYAPRSLTWLGDGSANRWDTGLSANWRTGDSSVPFTASDVVTFDATGVTNSLVDLVGTLLPGSIAVSAVADYTFSGTGVLAGPMTLAKSGPGRLTLTGPHGFTGATSLSGGTLEIRATGGLGTGAVANAATLGLAPAADSSLAFANSVSGSGALIVSGGTVTLSGDNSFSGVLTLASGSLILGHANALGTTASGTLVSPSATLDLAGFSIGAEPLTLAGGTLRNSANGSATFAGPLTVTAPSTLRATGPLTLSGSLGGNSPLTLAEGVLVLAGSSPATTNSLAVATGATLAGNGTLGGSLALSGVLAPSALSGSASTFTVRGSATLAPSSTLSLRLAKTNNAPASDRLTVQGTLTLGGTLAVALSGQPLSAGDTFTLFSAGSVSGDFAALSLPYLYADLVWDRSSLRDGVLRVQKLPAVSTAAQRREWLLSEAGNDSGSIDGFVMAAVWFARGDAATGRSAALTRSRSLVAKIRSSPVQVDLFDMWPAADLAVRHGAFLDAETLANIREALTTFTQYKDTVTSNLRTLAWVTRHLGGVAFGEDAFTSLGLANYWRTNDANAATELANQLASLVRNGFGEHASRPYYAKNLLPMLSIAQLAADPALRARASLAYEAGLAQNAHSWLRGHLGSPTSRSYPDVLRQQPISSLGLLWFHFGGDIFPRNNEAALQTALMNQPVSPLLELAASDRSAPFASRALLGNAHHSGWVDRDYILFSDGPRSVGNFQVYPNGVVWTEPDTSRNSFLWVAKPWRDDSGLNSSNPHGRNSGHYKETQLRDAALYIYNIPATGDAFPYALSNIPGGYRALLNEAATAGNIFLHYGSVLIALRSEQLFTWDPAGGVAFFSETPRAGDSEFRIFGTRFAVALETARPADFPVATPSEQLAAFRSAVLARPGPVSSAGTPPFATYVSRRGDALQVALSADPATRPISHNGSPINYNTWPVLESPWTFQDNTGPLVLRSATRRELLDFSSWTREVQTAPIVAAPASAVQVAPGQSLDLDLSLLAAASPESPGPLAFTVGEAIGGTVQLLADGRSARFTAGATPGPASFRFGARATGVDPARLALLFDYEDDFLSSNWIADRSGHRLTGTTSTVGAGARSLSTDVPPALAGLGARSLQLDQPGSTAAARFTRALAVTDHDLSDADWTFATWVRRATGTTHDMVFYLGSGDGFGGSGDELYLYFPANSNTLRIQHYTTSNVLDLDLATPAAATTGVWHHVAVTFTRTALNTGLVRLYLNGALAATSAPLTWAINQSSPLVIGGNNATTGSGPERWLDGRLDDSALFTRALSAEDVAALARMSVRQFTGLETSATIPVSVLTPREQWRLTHFGNSADTGSAADLADPDGDGVPNLLEYALGTTPVSAASASLPAISLTASAPPSLRLTFLRARADLTYLVEGSSTLAAGSWSLIATNPGAVGETVSVTDSAPVAPANPRRFLRLRITAAP